MVATVHNCSSGMPNPQLSVPEPKQRCSICGIDGSCSQVCGQCGAKLPRETERPSAFELASVHHLPFHAEATEVGNDWKFACLLMHGAAVRCLRRIVPKHK